MIELMFLEVLVLIRQVHLKNVLFTTIGTSRYLLLVFLWIKGLSFSHLFLMVAIMY